MAERTAAQIAEGLAAWAWLRTDSASPIENVRNLGGHSGDSFGFTHDGRELVVRVAPAGVKHAGSTDVLRQAPLLQTLRACGVAVAEVIDAFADARVFDAPCLIVSRLPGAPLIMGPDAVPPWLNPAEQADAHLLAAAELARINTVDAARLDGWETARSPADEIRAWERIWEKSPEDAWRQAGLTLRDRLLESVPDAWTLGICHGDFQTNNVLFVRREDSIGLGGVVDWEVAHLGAIEHDLAWFLMMNDAAAWDPAEQRGGMDHDAVVAEYAKIAGHRPSNMGWFQALACYRIAAIASYNIRLHRSGRRLDDAWERASLSIPRFFARASEHLEAAA